MSSVLHLYKHTYNERNRIHLMCIAIYNLRKRKEIGLFFLLLIS